MLVSVTIIQGPNKHSTDVQVGDEYINIKHPELGIRIATEETIRTILFTKGVNWGTCYLQKRK